MSVSFPSPPSRVLLPELPVIKFPRLFPVALMAEDPVSVRFSIFAPRLKLTEDWIKSFPAPEPSTTTSFVESTT